MTSSDDEDKMRVLLYAVEPDPEEMAELLSEIAALQHALGEVGDDEMEAEELKAAHRKSVGLLRLNIYRSGADPSRGYLL